MITDKERHILEAVVQVLEVAGIKPWFEARIIKDSDKQLNGKRISSKKRTDLASVLAVADKRRVGMLPNMRMELRMYATVAGSRSVFMGQELTGEAAPVVVGVDPGRPEGDSTAVMIRRGDQVMTVKEAVQAGAIDDSTAASLAGLGAPVIGEAHYSPAKNVERLREEGLAEDHPLMRQAKRKVVLDKPVPPTEARDSDYARMAHLVMHGQVMTDSSGLPPRLPGMPANPDAPLARMRTVAEHVCDANGPMRQQSPEGPFLTTCSLCGEFNAGST